jgi:hypothetical protein
MKGKRREFLSLLQIVDGSRVSASVYLRKNKRAAPRVSKKPARGCGRRFTRLVGEWLEPRTLLAGTASIAGTVWNDLDGDGSRGASEPGLGGVTVYLDLNDNNALDGGEPSQVSAADGSYAFQNLDAGNYVVREQTTANHRVTSPKASGQRLFVADGFTPPQRVVELNPTTGGQIRSFSTPCTGISISGGLAFDGTTLYAMCDGTDTLYKLNPNTGAVLGSTPLAAGTYGSMAAVGGKVYLFKPNNDSVAIFDPATNTVSGGYTFQAGVGPKDSLGESAGTNELLVASNYSVDFVDPATGIRTHSFQLGGPGYGFNVTSVQGIGNEIFVTHTDVSVIEVYSLSGTLLRTLNIAPVLLMSDGAGSADLSGANRLSLTSGQAATNVDFGDQYSLGSIRGVRWQDTNGNGIHDASEPPIVGKIMYLDFNDNGVRDNGEATAITGGDGSYVFSNLAPGTYVVRADVTAGFSQTFPANTKDRLFVIGGFQAKISELNPTTGAVLNSYFAPQVDSHAIAFDGKSVFYVSYGNDTLYKLNPDTGAIQGTLVLPINKLAAGLAAAGGLLYLDLQGSFAIVDPSTMQFVGAFTQNSLLDPFFYVGQMNKPDRLIGVGSSGQIVQVDPASGIASYGFTLAGGRAAITSLGSKFYSVDLLGKMSIYSSVGTLLQTITNVPGDHGVAGIGGTGGAQRITLTLGQTATGADFGTTEPFVINHRPDVAVNYFPTMPEDAGVQTALLSNISAGAGDSTQSITITATSSNPAIIPDPTVNYTSPATTGTLTYTPVPNQSGPVTITITVKDNGGTFGGGIDTISLPFDVMVTPVNDAPVLNTTKSPALPAVLEGAGSPGAAVGALVSSLVDFAVPAGQVDNVTDVDSGAVTGIAITAYSGALDCYYSLDGGTIWTYMGAYQNVSDSNALLLAADADNRVYCGPNNNYRDFDGTLNSALTFRAWDQTIGNDGGTANTTFNGGSTPFSTNVDSVSLAFIPVNDAPTAFGLSAAEIYTENVPLDLIDIVASDIDSATLTAKLTLSNPNAGSLSTATSGTVISTYDAATGVWTASGPIADINTLLAGVVFTPALNFIANFTIATSISDGEAAPVTGSKTMSATTITATNLKAAETYTEDIPLNLIDIVVSDAASTTVTASLTLSNTTAGSLSTGTSGAVASTYNAATGVWTASGLIANVNALLAGVIFTPTLNFNSNFTIATNISDGFAAAISGSKFMTGTPVNDAPTATNLSADESYTEDTPLNLTDIVVSDVDSFTATVRLTLSNVAAGSLTTGTSGTVTSTYDAVTGVWTAAGSIDSVNTLLAGVTFSPALNFNGNFSIATSVSDGSASITGSKSLTGTAVNDAPTATNLNATETYTEDTPLNLIDIVVSDVDSTTVTAKLTLSNGGAGSLSTATSGATTSTYIAATGIWTAAGPIADVNALLAGVTFNPTLNFNSNFTIATSVSDGVAAEVTGSKTMTGAAVDDPPTATNLSVAQTYTEDTSLDLTDIVVSDIDSTSAIATLTLSNSATGSLSTGTSGAVTSTYNAASGVWTASGAIADVNALLAAVNFLPALNYNGSLAIATSISDGIAPAITGSKSLSGIAVNDAPSATNLNAAETYSEDVPLDLTDIVISDVDSATVTATLTLSNANAGSLSTGVSGGVTSTYVGGVWTAFGVLANVNTLLAGVVFTPTLNFNGNFTITTKVTDGVAAAVTGSKSVTGVPVNDAPELINSKSPTLNSVVEDSGPPSGSVGSPVFTLVDLATPIGGLDNVLEADSSPLLGIAVVGVDPNFSCYYSLNSGGTWASLGTAAIHSAVLLAANASDRVYCQPAADLSGLFTSAFSFRAWDQTSGTNGGTVDTTISGGATAFSTAIGGVRLTVSAVNDAPVRTGPAANLAAVSEDSSDPADDSVSNLFGSLFHDVDGTMIASGGVALIGNSATASQGSWQISSGGGSFIKLPALADPAAVILLAASDLVRFLPAPDFNGVPGALRARLWDGTGGFSASDSYQDISASIGSTGAFSDNANEVTLNTTISQVNDPPSFDSFTGSSTAGDENPQTHGPALQKKELGWAKNINPGAPFEANQKLTFTVTNDNHDLFAIQPAIDPQGNLTYTPKPNSQGVATVTVTLNDDAGGDDTSSSQQFDIVITKTHRLHNAAEAGSRTGLDVTGATSNQPDGFIVAGDVLAVINYINANGSGRIPDNAAAGSSYPDVTADDNVAADDVLKIINYINAHPGQSEGESPADNLVGLPVSPINTSSTLDSLYLLIATDVISTNYRRSRAVI